MKILLASSEVHPYSKSGGLADMVGALAKFLARAGHQVGVVTPLYRGIRERFPEIKPFDWDFNLPLGNDFVQATVWSGEFEERLMFYFIDQPGFYQRANLYEEKGISYPDNAERFIFFSKCVANLARYLPWKPELVHGHDWQTGLVPLLILHQRLHDGWSDAPRTCLTIHNLAYQGVFPKSQFAATNLPASYLHPEGVEFFDYMSCLKTGICFSDMLTTVSPRYAREITTELFGCALDGVLRRRQDSLAGILNGVDYDEWKTEGNPYLKHSYSIADLSGKQANKLELQKEMGLPVNAKVPLFGTVSRLADQKGMDIELGALEEMLSAEMQFVLLGSGSGDFEKGFRKLAARYPTKVAVKIGFDQGLSHRIEAACDFFLMPSKFEPCGLNQMYSLHYGTIPIVRRTGGLDDSVTDISDNAERANGIKFQEISVRALSKSIRKALVLYENKPVLTHYIRNAMQKDFSWERTTKEYEKFYRNFL
ncbi:MAG: glycogen synthase GlgA [Verrucomicrobiota bacterium]